jgi:hypothetical protein
VWGIFKLFQTEQDRKNSAARKALDNLSKSYRR